MVGGLGDASLGLRSVAAKQIYCRSPQTLIIRVHAFSAAKNMFNALHLGVRRGDRDIEIFLQQIKDSLL